MTAESKVKVRFPPSPTGPLHLGGARTALFNWLFARKHNGTFVFRIEDTDKERSKREFEDGMIEALAWLGLDWDEGIRKEKPGESYRQSERGAAYKNYLERLLAEDRAYWCYCSKEDLEAEKQLAIAEGRPPRYSGRCRNLALPPAGKEPQVVRLKVGAGRVEFQDLIRGHVKFDSGLLDDFIIARSLDYALYNFAVVIDDFDMGITHVIRGEDHISNTPKQILIQKALDLPTPKYAHMPLVLNKERAKLSKRNADVAVLEYREKGYLPQALVNYLALLGWHPSDDREVFTLEELVREFDIARVQKAGAVWNEEKLIWLNREHMKRLSTEELETAIAPFFPRPENSSREFFHEVIEAVRERMRSLTDFPELAGFFFELPDYGRDLLVWNKENAAETGEVLDALKVLRDISVYTKEEIQKALAPLIGQYGKGNVLWPLRAALSGKEASPDPYLLAEVLGKEETTNRLMAAEKKFKE